MRCANTEALNRYIDDQDKREAIYNDEIERFKNEMEPMIDELIVNFGMFAKISGIDRAELRAILLEDIAEQL
jgi:hypothetical protein